MQKRLKHYLGMIFLMESVIGVFILTVFVMRHAIRDAEKGLLIWILDFSIIAAIVVMILVLFLSGRWLYRYIVDLESAQDQSDTLNREVISNITHDLKTPLTAIKGYAQGILDGVAGSPDRMNKYVLTIRNKADDMAGMVDELSFFAQIYQKDLEYHWLDVNARDYFSECISELSLDLETRNISLIYRYDAVEAGMIHIDREKLKRVINNVIGNAAKYIQRETGIVFVNIEETEEEVIVCITDNGVGIPQDELKRVFERFYRTDSSRNSKTGGSGLGLAIAKKIMEEHGGKIWAESKIGKGTRISFCLPKVKSEGERYDSISG